MNHRTTEQPMLEGISRDHQVQLFLGKGSLDLAPWLITF